MRIFITDNDGHPIPVDGRSVVIELNGGETIGVTEEHSQDDVPEGINPWDEREPSPSLFFEEIKARTEGLGIYPITASAPRVSSYKLSSKERSHTAGETLFSNRSKTMAIKKTPALGEVSSLIFATF